MTSNRRSRRHVTPPPKAERSRETTVVCIGLCALVLIAYANSFSVGFPLDSKQLILNDPRVHAATSSNVELILQRSYWWPYGESGLYRPVTTLSYLFNYAVLGNADRPAGYHVFNLALHAVNVILVFTLTRRITQQQDAALAAAAVWAVTPLSTEAVTNIVGRADLLAAIAVLCGFLIYLESRDAAPAARWRWLAALSATTAIGVFSKESAVSIVLVIGAYEVVWWTRGRSLGSLLRAGAAMAPPLLLMWWQRLAVLNAAKPAEFPFVDNPITGASFWVGRLTAVKVIAHYLWLLLWPANLSVDYSYAQIPLVRGTVEDWIACVSVVALAGAALSFRKRQRALFFFAAFAFLTFLPASNLLVPTGTILAERLMYLPSVGVAAIFATALLAAGRTAKARAAAGVLIAVVVVAFAVRTWIRNGDWRDDVTIWTAAVKVSPASAKTHHALAEALYGADPTRSNIDTVIAEAEQSVALLAPVPDELSSFTIYRRAAAYHLEKADEIHRRAQGANLTAADDARRSYARAATLLNRCLDIIAASSKQLDIDASAASADARRLLAASYFGLQDRRRALDEATKARELDPLAAISHRLVARAHVGNNQPDAAAIAYVVGSLVTSDAMLRQELIDLYRSVPDVAACAVIDTPTGRLLNAKCPVVQRHICAATAQAVAWNLRLGRRAEAERLQAAAVRDVGCAAPR